MNKIKEIIEKMSQHKKQTHTKAIDNTSKYFLKMKTMHMDVKQLFFTKIHEMDVFGNFYYLKEFSMFVIRFKFYKNYFLTIN